MAKKSDRPTAPKVPAAYGKMLVDRANVELGLSRGELADFAGISDQTAWRVEVGHIHSSIKAANAMREVLVRNGLEVPPVPIGVNDWSPTPPKTPTIVLENASDELVRKNLVRFREALGLDQFAAASATGVPYEKLSTYESGKEIPPSATLFTIAEKYGCRAGDFFEDVIPKFDLERVPEAWYGGPATKHLTEEERATIERVLAGVTERTRAAKRAQADLSKGKKRK